MSSVDNSSLTVDCCTAVSVHCKANWSGIMVNSDFTSKDTSLLRSFRPMPCLPGPRVVSPGVCSQFARTGPVHTYTYVSGRLFRTRNIHTPFSPVYSSLDQSEKNLEFDLILFILRSSRKRLIFDPRAKRSTSYSGRIDSHSGRKDSGRSGHRVKRPASVLRFLHYLNRVHKVLSELYFAS